jgi:hypothetical protein
MATPSRPSKAFGSMRAAFSDDEEDSDLVESDVASSSAEVELTSPVRSAAEARVPAARLPAEIAVEPLTAKRAASRPRLPEEDMSDHDAAPVQPPPDTAPDAVDSSDESGTDDGASPNLWPTASARPDARASVEAKGKAAVAAARGGVLDTPLVERERPAFASGGLDTAAESGARARRQPAAQLTRAAFSSDFGIALGAEVEAEADADAQTALAALSADFRIAPGSEAVSDADADAEASLLADISPIAPPTAALAGAAGAAAFTGGLASVHPTSRRAAAQQPTPHTAVAPRTALARGGGATPRALGGRARPDGGDGRLAGGGALLDLHTALDAAAGSADTEAAGAKQGAARMGAALGDVASDDESDDNDDDDDDDDADDADEADVVVKQLRFSPKGRAPNASTVASPSRAAAPALLLPAQPYRAAQASARAAAAAAAVAPGAAAATPRARSPSSAAARPRAPAATDGPGGARGAAMQTQTELTGRDLNLLLARARMAGAGSWGLGARARAEGAAAGNADSAWAPPGAEAREGDHDGARQDGRQDSRHRHGDRYMPGVGLLAGRAPAPGWERAWQAHRRRARVERPLGGARTPPASWARGGGGEAGARAFWGDDAGAGAGGAGGGARRGAAPRWAAHAAAFGGGRVEAGPGRGGAAPFQFHSWRLFHDERRRLAMGAAAAAAAAAASYIASAPAAGGGATAAFWPTLPNGSPSAAAAAYRWAYAPLATPSAGAETFGARAHRLTDGPSDRRSDSQAGGQSGRH